MVDATGHRARIMSGIAAPQHQVAISAPGIQASWRRCLNIYGMDPTDKRRPPIVSEREVRSRIAVLGHGEEIYRQGLSELSSLLDSSGYEVSLCDSEGVTLLNVPSRLDTGVRNVEMPGTTWTEAVVGTNGIGTCLWNARPVSVVADDHFLSCYANKNCAAAPIKDCDANILAVINITAHSVSVSRETHVLASEFLNRSAERIGRRLFRLENSGCCLVELLIGQKGPGLLALKEEGTIFSADLRAQAFLSLGSGPRLDVNALRGTLIWEYFDRHDELFGHREPHRPIPLTRITTGVQVAARATFPQARLAPSPRLSARLLSPEPVSGFVSIRLACGDDPRMAQNAHFLEKVKDIGIPVLLLGETGVGKSVLAQAIHSSSVRAAGPYVCVSCAGLSEASLTQQLFGGSGGPGVDSRNQGNEVGRFLMADGGTVVLDQIGELPGGLQSKLLRFVETPELVLPDGQTRAVNARIIATGSAALLRAVQEGKFRADLFYRIAGATIDIPPLRRRRDFELMVLNIVRKHVVSSAITVSDSAMAMLASCQWPGNLRQLDNVIVRAICILDGRSIETEHLLLDPVLRADSDLRELPEVEAFKSERSNSSPRMTEKAIVNSAMLQANGDITVAMKILGISRATLYRKLKAYDLIRLTRRAQANSKERHTSH
jgi:transcriptional regulator of acetoin/glycerol metabolism